MKNNYRIIHLEFTDGLSVKTDNISKKYQLSNLTVIDTSKDFNQNKWLGQELSDTLIYITPKTRINGILSVCGCVRGGCHLFFVFEVGEYPRFFQEFFIPKLKEIIKIQQKQIQQYQKKNDSFFSIRSLKSENIVDTDMLVRLKETIKAGQITHLIGERGTGKSTQLGLFIDFLCNDKKNNVVLLSPSRLSSQNTLKYLSDVSRETFQFHTPQSLDFSILSLATDIIVDEAASISREVLEKISQYCNAKIIFSTTIDGYEGTGQSYRLNYLNQKSNNVIHLSEPKRFSQNDLLYRLSQRLCFPENNEKIHLADGVSLFLSQTMQEKRLLLPTFALLQSAHYRTTPNDFANFYDNNAAFVTLVKNNALVGAMHLLKEELSEVSSSLITDIINGKRRVKNAMTQQALLNAYGMDNEVTGIAKANILRVSRIVTDENYRRQGIATKMINYMVDVAKEQQIDFISTSFSGKSETLQFWLSQGFTPVRIGVNKNKWHNEFSLLMLKSLSVKSETITEKLQGYFVRHYGYYQNSYQSQGRGLSKIIEQTLLYYQINNEKLVITKDELIKNADSVVQHCRDIHWVLPIVHYWAKQNSHNEQLLNDISETLKISLNGNFVAKNNKTKYINLLLLLKEHFSLPPSYYEY